MRSEFPSIWKYAKVFPIPKNSSRSKPEDYRPISILPCLSKVFEILMRNQINEHLSQKKLLSSCQSGFRKNHSCTTAIVKILEELRCDFDNEKISILCLLDFSKAFDSVNHSILIKKLKHNFFFSKNSLFLVASYLGGRFQQVCTDLGVSSFLKVFCGVPQGSILGPLLFSLFINDLPEVCHDATMDLYADDAQIKFSRPSGLIEDCVARLNEDLERIHAWALSNKLQLNPQKSKGIIISKNQIDDACIPALILNNKIVPYVDEVKNLGIIINRKLSCENHINLVVKRIYSGLRQLYISSNVIPVAIKLKLVRSLFVPLFNYCAVIYSNPDTASFRKLELAFNSTIRFIYGLRKFDRISRFSSNVTGCTLRQHFNIRNCIFLHNIIQTRQPAYLFEKITFAVSNRSQILILPRFKY